MFSPSQLSSAANKRIKLARRAAGGLASGRGARSLSAMR